MVKLIKNDVQYYKIMWYKELTRDPRSLQHYCRCVVRKAMGVRRLGQIDTLPLPSTLKDYLHLRMEEFSVSIPETPDTWRAIPQWQFPLSHVEPKSNIQCNTVLSAKGCFSFRTSFDRFFWCNFWIVSCQYCTSRNLVVSQTICHIIHVVQKLFRLRCKDRLKWSYYHKNPILQCQTCKIIKILEWIFDSSVYATCFFEVPRFYRFIT